MRDENRNIRSGLRRWLTVVTAAALIGCGSPSENSSNAPAPESSPQSAETAPEPAAPPAGSTQPGTQPAGVQESVAAESGDGGEELKLASAATAAGETNWRYQEGQDFKVLTTAQGTTGAPDKIEVIEAFWYGCPHCYQFDPIISEWAKQLPGDVRFVRMPVMWNPTHQIHARLFYTAVALGKIDRLHTEIFREIHVNQNMLTSEEDIQAFFARFGVSADEFKKTFRSFGVESQLARAKDLTQRYQVRSVPLMIVNGKYNTDAPGVKSFENSLAVVAELIERERRG
jgi:thiol:disulfide interchange protein DsbA